MYVYIYPQTLGITPGGDVNLSRHRGEIAGLVE